MGTKVKQWEHKLVKSERVDTESLMRMLNPDNARIHPDSQIEATEEMIAAIGLIDEIKINVNSGKCVNGHLRIQLAYAAGQKELPVNYYDLTEGEEKLALKAFDAITGGATYDLDKLAALSRATADLTVNSENLNSLMDAVKARTEAERNGAAENAGADSPPQADIAAELLEKWKVTPGSLWELGDHLLICGDSTDSATIARLFPDGEPAALCHADPPYGMGKEKDGIANDNLYREKLDAFQIAWWNAARPYLNDNASCYIWGNSEDLWRLWYKGGLKDSERLTYRNAITWDKGDAGAGGISHQGAEGFRMYPNGSERCLFFMLGEQGFNNNADNYWEGWEPIQAYLKEERDKMGWSGIDLKRIAGHSPSGHGDHWTGLSQWTMPTREVYDSWRTAAKNDAFKKEYDELKKEYDELKKEYDELKKEWYATRAYFDNTHDLMTDVWEFPRVTGAERLDHATPKPLAMIERCVKTSTPPGAIVLAPFGGSGTTLIAAQNLNRKCRMVELSPAYCAVIIQRWVDHTGGEPELIM